MAWRSPLDIMRKHKIKRSSSDASVGTRSPLTTTLVRQGSEGSKGSPATPKSNLGQATSRSSQKRRNPFIREPTRSPKKRKSLMKQSPQKMSLAVKTPDESETSESVLPESMGGREKLNLFSTLDSLEDDKGCDLPSRKEPENFTSRKSDEQLTPLISPKSFTEAPPLKELKAVLEEKKTLKSYHGSPPVDWSIKTKLRLVTPAEVNPRARRPGSEARHLHGFVHHSLETGDGLSESVRQCCFHYAHPHLPWLSAFPRTSQHYRTRIPSVAANNEDILKALHKDWCGAFSSVYQQLRCGLVPYFYLCCHQFTVLFRCQRSQGTESSKGNTSWSALLSPSTRGLRELLIKEGIPFSLPNSSMDHSSKPCDDDSSNNSPEGKENSPPDTLLTRRRPSVKVTDVLSEIKDIDEAEEEKEIDREDKDLKHEDNEEVSDDEEDLTQQHDGASQWLQSLGMDRKDFPELEPDKVKIQLEGYKEIDNRSTSMIYVEGPDIHPFFDFLINFQNCTAPSGDQMGLPPTLLAPGPFQGATLVHNSVKVSTIKDSSMDDLPVNVYEIFGPILPHHTLNIASILKTQYEHKPSVSGSSPKSGISTLSKQTGHLRASTQSGHIATHSQPSVMSYSTHTPSAAFNTHKVNDPVKDKMAEAWQRMTVDPCQTAAGLHSSAKDSLSAAPLLTSGQFVRDLEVCHKGFSWS